MSKKEIELFRHFLECPIHNYRPDHKIITFFDHCQDQKVWKKDVLPSDFLHRSALDLTDSLLDRRVSALNQQLSRFVGILNFSRSEILYWPHTLAFCNEKQLEHAQLDSKKSDGTKKINKEVQDANYFQLMLEMEQAAFSPSRGLSNEARPFANLTSFLDNFYLIRKLRIMCAHANVKHIFSDEADPTPESHTALISWMKVLYSEMSTLAKVYFHCYHVISNIHDTEHYEEFKTHLDVWELKANGKNHLETMELYGYLTNIYVTKLNSGDLSVAVKMEKLYSKSLAQGFVLVNGSISPENFVNILRAKARVGKLAEARTFFENYKDKLSETHDGIVITYNEMVLNYYDKNLLEAIRLAEKLVEVTGPIKADEYYGITIRMLLLRAYFEALSLVDLNDWDHIDEKLKLLLRAFPAYLDRRHLPAIKILDINNFRKSLQQLYNVAFDYAPGPEQAQKAKELLLDYKSSSNLSSKNWFIRQAKALSGTS